MYQATRTVDGGNLSEIAIHNFEKNRKIENRILPYGKSLSVYLDPLKRSRDIDSSTLGVFGVGVAPL